MKYIENLEWRYATKKFNPKRKINEDTLERILQSGNLTASSMGLQPLKIVNVQSVEKREELLAHSFNQKQVVDASHLLIICSYADITEQDVDKYIQFIASERAQKLETLEGFSAMIKGNIGNFKTTSQKDEWLAKQAYIVLGTLLTTCALEKVDSCPMEGFIPSEYSRILGLDELNLKPILALPIGYRSPEDVLQWAKKIRKPIADYVVNI